MGENQQLKIGIFRKTFFVRKYFYIFATYRPNGDQKCIGLLYKTQHSAQYIRWGTYIKEGGKSPPTGGDFTAGGGGVF